MHLAVIVVSSCGGCYLLGTWYTKATKSRKPSEGYCKKVTSPCLKDSTSLANRDGKVYADVFGNDGGD